MTEQPPARSWLRVGLPDLVFVLMAVGLVRAAHASTMLNDPCLGWHVRTVDAILANGGFFDTDPFSGPRGGSRWLTNQWLGDVPLWLGERWAGLTGIAVVNTLLLAFIFRLF